MRAGTPITQRSDLETLRQPTAALWKQRPANRIELSQTPAGLQPGQYVAGVYANRPYGMLREATLRCAWHTEGGTYFHLTWHCTAPQKTITDTDQFVDAAALLFADREEIPLITMGAPGMPVASWYWRADRETPFLVTAEGLGSTRRTSPTQLQATGIWDQGMWQVVIGHPTERLPERLGVAVWQGTAADRGGLKAATLSWTAVQARP